MTKKDFVLLAAALKSEKPEAAGYHSEDTEHVRMLSWKAACFAIADACATTNPLFDRPKFLDACGTN